MEFAELQQRALDVRGRFDEYERATFGRAWSDDELVLGLVGDLGDLAKLMQARAGVRAIDDVQERLAHELGDVLWSVIAIAERCGVDLEAAFLRTMSELEVWLSAR